MYNVHVYNFFDQNMNFVWINHFRENGKLHKITIFF